MPSERLVGSKGKSMDDRILLTNIQRFSLHDGPGIRTTVFLKGCSLRCPWCSNPENLLPVTQQYIKDGVKGTYGKYYTADELVKECLKDKGFYEGAIGDPALWKINDAAQIDSLPGGVTFSGGEALLQVEKLLPVCEKLHQQDIHIAVETALFILPSLLEIGVKHIDFFYVDMKILNKGRCREVEKSNLDIYLSNLEVLMNSDVPVAIRVPVIGGYTDGDENRHAVKMLLSKYRDRVLKVELIKEHNLGESKYKSLKMNMDYHGVDDNLMEQYKTELDELGLAVEICKI